MEMLSDMATQMDKAQRARDFSRRVFALGVSATTGTPLDHVIERTPGFERLTKAVVPAATTASLAPLAGSPDARAFINLFAKRTVLGRLDSVLSAPPNMLIPRPTATPSRHGSRPVRRCP